MSTSQVHPHSMCGATRTLYTSIPHRIVLMALEYHLNKPSTFLYDLQEFTLLVTSFIMTHN